MRYVCPKDVQEMLLQYARKVNCKKWVAKHEYEELKEVFGWSRLFRCCAKRRRKIGLKSIGMLPDNYSWKEAGCSKKTLRHWLVGRK